MARIKQERTPNTGGSKVADTREKEQLTFRETGGWGSTDGMFGVGLIVVPLGRSRAGRARQAGIQDN